MRNEMVGRHCQKEQRDVDRGGGCVARDRGVLCEFVSTGCTSGRERRWINSQATATRPRQPSIFVCKSGDRRDSAPGRSDCESGRGRMRISVGIASAGTHSPLPPPEGEVAVFNPIVQPLTRFLLLDIDAALEQQVFHVPQRQRVADIHHHHEPGITSGEEWEYRTGPTEGLPMPTVTAPGFALTAPATQLN